MFHSAVIFFKAYLNLVKCNIFLTILIHANVCVYNILNKLYGKTKQKRSVTKK
jgi:hypothetical protein